MIKFGSVRGNFFQHFFSLVSSLAFSAMPKSSIKTVSKRGTKRQPKSAWKSSSKKRKINNSQPSSDKSKRKTKSKDEEKQEQSKEDLAHAESDNNNNNNNDPARKYQKIIELARFVPMMLHPQPSFYEIFQMGLEDAGLLEIPLCNLPSRDKERNQLRKFYNFFKNQLGNWFEDILLEAVNEECVSDLVSHAFTDGILQDVRHLKDPILKYIEDTIDLLSFLSSSQILSELSGTRVRRWPDIVNSLACVLLRRPRGRSVFGFLRAFHRAIARHWSISTSVRTMHKSFAPTSWRCVWVDPIAKSLGELVLQVRHSLSSCDNRRCEEGSVVKLDVYDAVMALANNPEYFNKDCLENVEEFYAEIVGWMLPKEEKPHLQNNEDPHCGLSLISKLLALQKQAAEEERAKVEAAPGTDKGEDSSEDGSIEMVASSCCGSPPPPSSDAEAVDLFNDDEVPETEDKTDPPPVCSNALFFFLYLLIIPVENSSALSSHPSSSSKSSRSFSALGSSNVFAYKNASTSKPSSSSLRVAVPEKRAKMSQVEKDPLAKSQRSIIPTKKGKAKITIANPVRFCLLDGLFFADDNTTKKAIRSSNKACQGTFNLQFPPQSLPFYHKFKQTRNLDSSNMRKAAKNFQNNAKKIFNKDASCSATPTGSRSSTPAPEPENAQEVSSTNQPLAVTSKTVVNTLDTTLGILKEVSAAFPPLQAAVGGVIE
ncbi:hypothetical protein D9757_014743 [Collybiopsis confluens]|uniref:Uncharacterized protein n=1 Tax=Collybiopsis confluens TaxID=2823264 RepID=A0A8H5CLK2_9AGAR|nr:hypothetical protein D9757_014743 [Collybiopsis confluens]